MKIIYKKTLLDTIKEEVELAKTEGKVIQKFILTLEEYMRLLDTIKAEGKVIQKFILTLEEYMRLLEEETGTRLLDEYTQDMPDFYYEGIRITLED